jgi:phage host-nuclease inhibitor protein Gam
MDVETAEAVDTLRADIHRVGREVVRVETSLTARIEHVETSLTAKIEQVESSLTAKIHELNEDAKRHTDMRIEDVRDDIRILAEGFASLSATVESLRR